MNFYETYLKNELQENLNQAKRNFQDMNSLLKMYQNKNNEYLTGLPDSCLEILESSLFKLINTVKTEKTLRTLYHGMKVAMISKEETFTDSASIFKTFLSIKKTLTSNPPCSDEDISNYLKINEMENLSAKSNCDETNELIPIESKIKKIINYDIIFL